MTQEAYCRDPRFEAHGAAVKWAPELPAVWYDEPELRRILAAQDWSDIALCCHHSQFDGCVLNWHYDVRPAFWFCTMSMAKMLYGAHIRVGLDPLRQMFGIPAKTTPYNLFKNLHWSEMPETTRQLVARGAEDEVNSIWYIFQQLGKEFPPEEYRVLDTTIRMFTEPQLRADTSLLAKVWTDEANKKEKLLAQLNLDESDLQSADKFAELLRAEGVEPEMKQGKNGEIPAFAKTDDFMRKLLEDDNDTVRTLAEARLGCKSTFLQTRAEILGWMASRGSLPVYLSYAGTGTLRPSGGDKCNWLNFKRNSDIRRAIMAPEGFLLAPIDSSQIECRVLHYLAGGADEPVLQMFRAGVDPYADLATKFYGETIYKPTYDDPRRTEMEQKRGAGKQGRLMCFGPNTVVLTDCGPKAITAVELTDRLWDGVEWVAHQGLVFQGISEVISPLEGVWGTGDHSVLCGNLWNPLSQLQDVNIKFRALASGLENLPLPDINWGPREAWSLWWFAVLAERQNTRLMFTTYMQNAQRVATHVLKKLLGIGLKNTTVTPMYALTNPIGGVYLGASELSTFARDQKTVLHTRIMEDEAFRFMDLGKKDTKVAGHFWNIWLLFQDGINQIYKLIEGIIKKAIVPATCGLFHGLRKCKISDVSAISKMKLPTYDIAFAGPRNRFTILSAEGPLIVHNCGYGAAGKQFQATAKAGLYGPPIDMTREDADRFVQTYRLDTSSVCARHTGYWAQAKRMIARLAGGPPVQWGPLEIRDHKIYLPNGARMNYDTIEFYRPVEDDELAKLKEFERDGYWRVRTRQGWKKMWGSKLTQNICEAVSRVIVTQAMNRITAMGYRVLNHPYDELLTLIPKDGREQWHVERCVAEMKREVDWLPGLPLDAEFGLSERYSK